MYGIFKKCVFSSFKDFFFPPYLNLSLIFAFINSIANIQDSLKKTKNFSTKEFKNVLGFKCYVYIHFLAIYAFSKIIIKVP